MIYMFVCVCCDMKHGMGFDSSSPLAKSSGKGLRNQLSLTEAEYLEAQKRARHHQDAPKFRRDGKSKSHGHLPKQQHKSVTLPGDLMVNNSQDLSQVWSCYYCYQCSF